jgi:hypothetical protein
MIGAQLLKTITQDSGEETRLTFLTPGNLSGSRAVNDSFNRLIDCVHGYLECRLRLGSAEVVGVLLAVLPHCVVNPLAKILLNGMVNSRENICARYPYSVAEEKRTCSDQAAATGQLRSTM